MVHLTCDTCVWLNLLVTAIHRPDSPFDELLFWIEKGYVTCITTPNLQREWDRNKKDKKSELLSKIKQANELFRAASLTQGPAADPMFDPNRLEPLLDARIARLDTMFNTKAVVADEEDAIVPLAAKRSIDCVPPSHSKDSFRDCLNILHLIDFIRRKGLSNCYFTTHNHKDFCDVTRKESLHPSLQNDFDAVSLQFVYFSDSPSNYSGLFLNTLRSQGLPSFINYLNEKQRKEQQRQLDERKAIRQEEMKSTEGDYLENLPMIDLISSKKQPTAAEKKMLDILFTENPAYQRYFLEKIGKNGVA